MQAISLAVIKAVNQIKPYSLIKVRLKLKLIRCSKAQYNKKLKMQDKALSQLYQWPKLAIEGLIPSLIKKALVRITPTINSFLPNRL